MPLKLSETEWRIMEVLWCEAPLSATEVYERLADSLDSPAKSVRTLLDRLLSKQAVGRTRVHGVWVFRAAVAREACLQDESRSFLQRFFNADPVPLVAHLIQNEDLTDEQLAELRALLDKDRDDA